MMMNGSLKQSPNSHLGLIMASIWSVDFEGGKWEDIFRLADNVF